MCVAERKRIADCGDHQQHRSPKVTATNIINNNNNNNYCLIDSNNTGVDTIATTQPIDSMKDVLSNEQLTTITTRSNKTSSNNSIINTNNSINNTINTTNSNSTKTNVMDKLDPSLHCFLSPSFFSLYSLSLSLSPGINELEPTSQEIAKKIEEVLKQKKIIRNGSDLPSNLTKKIAQDIMTMSETEPCGLQGCLLYISLEDEDQKCQLIDTLKLGEKTIVPTFVMYLHLRRRYSDWFKLIAARFFRHLFKDSYTLHDVYKLSKRKLFRTLSPTCKS